jgi:hypothetical protein
MTKNRRTNSGKVKSSEKRLARRAVTSTEWTRQPKSPAPVAQFDEPARASVIKVPYETVPEAVRNGAVSQEWFTKILADVVEASCGTASAEGVAALVAAVKGIEPRDEIELMLAAQMIATHNAASRALSQLKSSELLLQQDSNVNIAIKLLRTFTAQMEALNRHRGSGTDAIVSARAAK